MSKASLVADVEMLVSRWGVDSVRKALEFVAGFSDDPSFVLAYDYDGGEHKITSAQYNELRVIYRDIGKIRSIKRIREMLGLGLREAKAAIEYLFEPAHYQEYR